MRQSAEYLVVHSSSQALIGSDELFYLRHRQELGDDCLTHFEKTVRRPHAHANTIIARVLQSPR